MPKVICPDCGEPNNDINPYCLKCKKAFFTQTYEEYPLYERLVSRIYAVIIAAVIGLCSFHSYRFSLLNLKLFDPEINSG